MGEIIKSLFPDDKSKKGLKVNSKQKKYLLWLVFIAVIGIFAMSMANLGSPKSTSQSNPIIKDTKAEQTETSNNTNLALTEKYMQERLEKILAEIVGVGEVLVNLTLDSSPELQYAINTKTDKTEISEQAQDGSTRTTSDSREDAQVVMKNMTQGQDEPVVIKEIRPQVVGVMIVAEGAENLIIKERISQAVQTLLNIPAHRVTVLPKGK